MKISVLRSAALLALASAALLAHAEFDAYSNFDPVGPTYSSSDAWFVGLNVDGNFYTEGFQFTSTASGRLNGFRLGMNDYLSSGEYTLQLFSSDPSGALGNLLGTYTGSSTQIPYVDTQYALSLVRATGPEVMLTSGATYWLVASSRESLAWNTSGAFGNHYSDGGGVGPRYSVDPMGAFSVQIAPSPAAALPFALMAIKRRRRKA